MRRALEQRREREREGMNQQKEEIYMCIANHELQRPGCMGRRTFMEALGVGVPPRSRSRVVNERVAA